MTASAHFSPLYRVSLEKIGYPTRPANGDIFRKQDNCIYTILWAPTKRIRDNVSRYIKSRWNELVGNSDDLPDVQVMDCEYKKPLDKIFTTPAGYYLKVIAPIYPYPGEFTPEVERGEYMLHYERARILLERVIKLTKCDLKIDIKPSVTPSEPYKEPTVEISISHDSDTLKILVNHIKRAIEDNKSKLENAGMKGYDIIESREGNLSRLQSCKIKIVGRPITQLHEATQIARRLDSECRAILGIAHKVDVEK